MWAFTNPGQFDFACLIPGHYGLGMKGSLKVTVDWVSRVAYTFDISP
ncbi:hypothetical protein FJ970_31590 (plasmid) [Mesorhizobium sp. B2-1-8]|nr:plastocyanin/azurin family copper-binding protein [Mesorhizobium sp. B2-1-8]UCI23038.1 hypothetical protein FJ970_31590 [Mesorhizobium sp. B2-1-8]